MSPYEYIFNDQYEIFPHEEKVGAALLMLLAALLWASNLGLIEWVTL